MKKKIALYVVGGLVGVLAIAGGVYGYLFAQSPLHVRYPKFEHYHFRTQVLVNGQAVDFSQAKFQQEYMKGSCSEELSEQPMHFHDGIDQMTHIHWDGITGGEVLKYYGWNFTGGSDDSLGQRFDRGFVQSVPTFGKQLPDVPQGANFYVYIGDEAGYQQKSWDDFLKQNLEDFFGKQSKLKQDQAFNPLDLLFSKAVAHGGEDHGISTGPDEHVPAAIQPSPEDLKRINNLIGNVVIFVQPNPPTDDEVKARFTMLVPLSDSACGG